MSISEGRTMHRAKLVGPNGEVSPLCAYTPKPVPNRETWTLVDSAVTCPGCVAAMIASGK